jgi:hypothetical protein
MVGRLNQGGAQINAKGSYYNGVTTLYAAAKAWHFEVVKMLLFYGADRDVMAGSKHWTTLRAAKYHGYVRVVELLENKR